MEMDLQKVINQWPRLSPTLFDELKTYAEFKVDFHNVSICARKDPEGKWHVLPYLVSKTDVQEVVGYWLLEWNESTMLEVGTSKGTQISTTQKQKEAAQKAARTLAEKKKKEAAKATEEKAQIEEEKPVKEKEKKEQNDDDESEKYAMHCTNEQEISKQGGGGDEEQSTPFILKKRRQEQMGGQRKKHKYEKRTHLDPMVLNEGDLDDISEKIRDTMIEVLQKFEQQCMQTL